MVCDVDLGVPDGARTHTVEVARGFSRAGLAVHLIARGPDPRLDGVIYHPAAGGEHERRRRSWSINRVAIPALWLERHAAGRLYVRDKWSTVPVAIVGRLLSYRVVSEMNDLAFGPSYQGEIRRSVDYVKRLMTFLMGRASNGVVAGTEEAKSLLAQEFHVPRDRIAVVPIGVDTEYFRPLDRDQCIARAGLDPSQRYALFIGHFAHWVDFDTLLEAFAAVLVTHPEVQLLLVGDGQERERIVSIIAQLNIAHAVIMTGFVRDRERIRDLLGAATLLLASHRHQDLDRIGMNATKIAEYLAAGRPIVAKDVARLREMIEKPGAGLVVPESAEAMAAAMVSVLEPGRGDQMGGAARREAVEHYSWDATIRLTLPLFETR
jgi:glycosyltransferase involved in cell wall biosynthesis